MTTRTETQPEQAAIHCHQCKKVNPPQAQKCAGCGANLLPGTSLVQRFVIFVCCTLLAVISFSSVQHLAKKVEPGDKNSIYVVGLLIFGLLILGYGFIQSLRKVPLDERYATRAKRHASLNKLQAIADYSSAMRIAPKHLVLNYLGERAKLEREVGMTEQAMSDWQRALEMVNERIAKANPPVPELFQQRADLHQNLGRPDEHSLDMLAYAIEKEKTLTTKEGELAESWEEGFIKGSEDVKRQELQKLRAGILQDPRFRIIAECKKCHKIVNLDSKLKCPKDKKHKVSNIRPVLRKTGPASVDPINPTT